MINKRTLLIAGLIFLPTLVLGGLVLKNESALAGAKTWRVKISGYDPRSLMYGHYLNFRYIWAGQQGETITTNAKTCLCLQPAPGQMNDGVPSPIVNTTNDCSSTQCASVLMDSHLPRQYYVPEKDAGKLERILRNPNRNVALDVRVVSKNWVSLGELYIDGTPWRDWIRQHPEELK